MSEEQNKMVRLKKDLKGTKKAAPRTRKKASEEEVLYEGKKTPKSEVQDSLNKLCSSERVIALTTHRQNQVVDRLKTLATDDLEGGMHLYAEYREAVNDDLDDPEGDSIEAYWVNGEFLHRLAERKAQKEFYERLRNTNK